MSLSLKTTADEAVLIAELRATFPGLFARPLAEWRPGLGCGVWVGGDSIRMPDGLPLFSDLATCKQEFDGFIHGAFAAWVELRGWYIESVDAFTHLIVPDPFVARAVDALHHAWYAKPDIPLQPGECPF